jgi:hypothetical protein
VRSVAARSVPRRLPPRHPRDNKERWISRAFCFSFSRPLRIRDQNPRDQSSCPARSDASPSEEWCKKAGEALTSAHTPRRGRSRDPGLARSTRTRIDCRRLGSEVAGARGNGTGARIPYLQNIADISYILIAQYAYWYLSVCL